MAIQVKRKIKPKKMPKSFEQMHYGDEPMIIGHATEVELVEAFNYYNYFFDHVQAKKWVLEYLKKNKAPSALIEGITNSSEYKTVPTNGWIARMMMNGTIFNDAYMERFHNRNAENAKYGVKSDEPNEKSSVSIQDRTKRVITQLITDAEKQFDLNPEFDVYEFLVKSGATQLAATALRDFYFPAFEEIRDGGDDIKEAYGKKQKYWFDIYQKIMDDCNRFIGNKKVVKVRKPRAKKVKSSIDLIKNLKYQKEFSPLKIVSVNPTEIIGASQLWVYSTKYKKLGVYNTMSSTGFSVKGTSLTGWDPERSLSKTLRKPELSISQLLQSGKVGLRTFMDNIKTTQSSVTGRLNEDIVILRVIK